ncbi:prephenate dehydrogenase/arogenate dehydrogenase family protein [Nocardioides sp.]|uniref:prephenate dehydrogenase n=1 Tax=Nocardioides sp. TaxID=35761 RepID=UPI002723592C|nr:prephenate dehydrogenase/arogenate dehydrogenase family protein [Nocardioides sp.]MDO9457956.1 prephenate dehydrogenase/arogenate dehydrogenase family protein [Nocardioides sp.]
MSTAPVFTRVAVVGAGLIGGSIARRLVGLGAYVVVVDPDPGTREAAAAAGLAVAETVPADRDLVVLAAPLDVIVATLPGVAAAAPDAVLVDVGSVKGTVRDACRDHGLESRWVGAHPMAGTELSGFDHADPGLLVDVSWAVTRGPGPVADVVRWVVDTFAATAVVLDADAHDRAVALVSHAPHVLANALLEVVERAADPAAAHLAAGSFRDGTRVAGRDPLRTRNMLADNAAALGPVVDDLVATLQDYRRDLDDRAALADRLAGVTAGADAVRRPEPRWQPCPDLDAALAGDGPVLVREGVSGLESAR